MPADNNSAAGRRTDKPRALRQRTCAFLALLLALAGGGAARGADDLTWREAPGCRYAELALPAAGKTGFTRLAPEVTGVTFTNVLSADRHLTNQILLNGSGVACGDVDGDGWCDLYFCGLDGPNQLYRNLGGWRFQDVTEASGAGCPNLDATGAALADLDGDGDLDLVVNSVGGGTHCFFNDGQGRFSQAGRNPGMNARRCGTTLALGDVDGDGDLDLYVANYRPVTLRDQPNTRFSFRIVNGEPVVSSIDGRPLTEPDLTNRFTFKLKLHETGGTFIHEENGEPDVLYRNDGRGNFTPVSWTDGTFLDEDGQPLAQAPYDWGLSVMCRDLNGDGAPDFYVCNDFNSMDRIWINDGRGRFRAIGRLAIRQVCMSSMAVDIADLNRDGRDDLFVLDMLSPEHVRRFAQRVDLRPDVPPFGMLDYRQQSSRNMLLLNRGDNTYAELAQMCGLEASDWSWTPLFLDVDLDGWEDLLIANGYERDNMNIDALRRIEVLKKQQKLTPVEQLRLRKLFPRLDTPNLAFHNLGNLKFEPVGEAWGFHDKGVSQGSALADLDNDGDLDVVVNNLNGLAGLYRNDTVAPRVAVRLKGQPPNTRGIGTRVKVAGGPVVQSQEIMAGGRYCSCDQAMRVFAGGSAASPLTIEVAWRSGKRTVVSNALPNRIYEVSEAAARPVPRPAPPEARTHFEDMSGRLGHRHHEEEFNDFERQSMMPHRLSQLGPGLAWCDLDGDGWEDLVVASGRGGQLAAFRNDGRGGFKPLTDAPFNQPVTRDQTTVLPWLKAPGELGLLVGSANYEDGLAVGGSVRFYDLAARMVGDALPGQASSTGPLALADLDGDGQLDLFVGGRVVPGRYPEAASSLIFRGVAGGFAPDAENTKRLAGVGLVSGAVFSDLTGDGFPELILACEWGPVRVFANERGKLSEATQSLGLAGFTGWWNGVATGDFDGDGRLDIVAANWGRNTKLERFRRESPLQLFYGDLDGNGTVEVVEAYFHKATQRLVPAQPHHLVTAGLPGLQERISSCDTYARLSLEEIFREPLKQARRLEAQWLDSTLFLNRGGRFEARPLPLEAQMTPAFAVCVGDLDGDGHEDVFLGQNFFGTQPDVSRYDAGRGLWLRGDGTGNLTPVPGQLSGLKIYGEQRGAALCDFDADGRADLAVTQNGAETKLYHNTGARPGLRLRLTGPPANPQGVGAVLRLAAGPRVGAAREIRAGSGYWSADSPVQVLSLPDGAKPAEVRITWPGGRKTVSLIPEGAAEVAVDPAGEATRVK
jgi:hypothetical protein